MGRNKSQKSLKLKNKSKQLSNLFGQAKLSSTSSDKDDYYCHYSNQYDQQNSSATINQHFEEDEEFIASTIKERLLKLFVLGAIFHNFSQLEPRIDQIEIVKSRRDTNRINWSSLIILILIIAAYTYVSYNVISYFTRSY